MNEKHSDGKQLQVPYSLIYLNDKMPASAHTELFGLHIIQAAFQHQPPVCWEQLAGYGAGTLELEEAAVSTCVPLSGLQSGSYLPMAMRMSAALFSNSEKRLLRRDRAVGWLNNETYLRAFRGLFAKLKKTLQLACIKKTRSV